MRNFSEMPLLAHEEVTLGPVPCRIVRRELAGDAAATLIVGREHLPEFVARTCGARAHSWWLARRDGRAQLDPPGMWDAVVWHDYDDKQIPHEAGLEHSHINYEKGCYTGQEIVERVRSRGHVNRRLTELRFAPLSCRPLARSCCSEEMKLEASPALHFHPCSAGRLALATCGASIPRSEPAWTLREFPRK